MIVDGTIVAAGERLKTFDEYARAARNAVERDNMDRAADLNVSRYNSNPEQVRQKRTFDVQSARNALFVNSSLRQTARLSASQTLLAIVLAIVNFIAVYMQDKIGGTTNAAFVVGGASLLIGSTIPYARCC